MTTKVFVYGSLKRGFQNTEFLRNAEFVQADTVMYPGQMVDLGYFPGVLHTGDHLNPIKGEVWSVTPETLQGLDGLEGHPDFYTRVERTTKAGEDVWIYVLFDHDGWGGRHVIEDGDWKQEYVR